MAMLCRSPLNLDIGQLVALSSNHLASCSVEQGVVVFDCTLGQIVAHRDDIRPIRMICAQKPLFSGDIGEGSETGDVGVDDILALICDRTTIINIKLTNDGLILYKKNFYYINIKQLKLNYVIPTFIFTFTLYLLHILKTLTVLINFKIM